MPAATRAAVWRGAGPRRERDPLEALRDDPYPLARLIARSALARRESRGAQLRTDFPLPDPALDGVHVCVDPADELRLDRWI